MVFILKFIFRSIILGGIFLLVIFLIVSPIISLYNIYWETIQFYQIVLFLITAFLIGSLLSLIYVTPLYFFAKSSLKLVTLFYQEFLKLGAKYFAKENQNKPFEIVVEVTINEKIRILGFLANRMTDNSYVVFIPTSRRLTSGISIIVDYSNIKETNVTPENFLKYTMTNAAFQLDLFKIK